MTGSWDEAVFDAIYARDPDPWRFETSSYERRKYRATLSLLPRGRRFDNALELGCSIGVFSRALAPRCAALLGIDCAAAALGRARLACADQPQVRFERGTLPASFPEGSFDLVVISELLYFLSGPDIGDLASRVCAACRPGALVLLANWTGATDTPCTGDVAASLFRERASGRLTPRSARRAASYRLDLLSAA